ncbi:MAG: membrane protein insertase YidC [Candidatus Goldbacteria bacterium]|nr:membrane protein insertase YidC [Candidatus Goldiibacteriota bacterium]
MSNDASRLIIFIILSGIILFVYNLLFPVKPNTASVTPGQTMTTTVIQSAAVTPASPSISAVDKQQKLSTITEKTYVVENDLVKVSFSSIGAVLRSYELKKYSDSKDENKKTNLELIPSKTANTYMALYLKDFPINKDQWIYVSTERKNGTTKISFKYDKIKNVEITKEYTLNDDSYVLNLNITFKNKTKSPVILRDMNLSWGPNIHYLPADVNKNKDSFRPYCKIAYPLKNNSIKQYQINLNAKSDKITLLDTIPPWIALRDSYFMTAFIPENVSDIKNVSYSELAGGFTYLTLGLNDVLLEQNSSVSIKINSFTGPQEYKRLKKLNMQNVIDMGWFRFLGIWMFYAMDILYAITKNYGMAILLLTLIVRLILWIPSQQSYKQMKDTQSKMKIINPRLETLKKIYKDDPQKLNEEMLKLYKEYKINPLGGCLPMLFQLPIFVALYQTLISMVELKGASFMWWLKDLSRPDPFYILPIFMGVTTIIQQKMSQTTNVSTENMTQQKILMYGMPIFLTVLALSWPSGLLLYWGMSNVLAIAQQMLVNKTK